MIAAARTFVMSTPAVVALPPPAPYYHYRATALGRSLHTALQQLQQTGELTPQQSQHALLLFDAAINGALSERVKADVSVSGRLEVYRHCDDVWTMVMRDVRLVGAEGMLVSQAVKSVAYEKRSKKKQK